MWEAVLLWLSVGLDASPVRRRGISVSADLVLGLCRLCCKVGRWGSCDGLDVVVLLL